jgi:hypothetical protein
MALTMTRWIGAAAFACALIATASLRGDHTPPSKAPPSADTLRLRQLRQQIAQTARRWEALERRDSVLARIPERGDARGLAPLLAIDPRLPKEHRLIIERAIHRHWASLGIDSARIPVTVAVVIDTAASPDWRGGRGGELAYDYLLPTAARTGRDRGCIAIITVQAGQLVTPGSQRRFTRLVATPKLASSLLGPCAFLARFGTPGAEIDRWLRSRSYEIASIPQWSSLALADSGPVGERWRLANAGLPTSAAVMWLSPDAVGCTAGEIDRCRSTMEAPAGSDSTPPGGLIVVQARRDQHWGPMSSRYLADLVTALGPERFERFWRSELAPDDALRAVARMPLDVWTQQWAVGLLGEQRIGPALSLIELIGALTVAGMSLALAAWGWGRREVR